MKIWHNQLSGNVDIINGLNHYIGMKHISADMFPEFHYIGILLGILIVVGLAAALLASGRILFLFTLLSYVYGVAALWDFWRWGYDYGHNLDPNAAIKVPGMSYQPPLIGYKNLLNFTSFSGPDTGAWIIIAVCAMATVLWWWEFFKHHKNKRITNGSSMGKAVAGLFLPVLFSLGACQTGPEPIRYGQDSCQHCKMTLMDQRFGAEIVTKKGRVYKFDDLNCLVAHLKAGQVAADQVEQLVAVDFAQKGQFVSLQKAFFLQNEALKSPMRADVAVFSDMKALENVRTLLGSGQTPTWQALQSTL